MAKDLKNILLSTIEENKIKEKTPDKLPLNPTAEGWSGHEVRRFLAKSLIDSEGSFLSEFKKKMIEIKTQFEDVFGDGDGDIQGQIDIIFQDIASIEGNYFDFAWVPNNETQTPNGIDIITIPDNSLGDLVTDEETLANYFNKEDSQYPPKEWKYRIIKYKRGTSVLEILSTGVMKFSQESIEDLINSRFNEIEEIIDNKETEVDIMIGVVTVMDTTLPLSGFKTIDGVTVESKDRVLVTGLGKEHNGIYEVNENGTWKLLQEVKPNQVVSVELGYEYGGSLQKKEHNGVTVMVKKPERTQWRVLI